MYLSDETMDFHQQQFKIALLETGQNEIMEKWGIHAQGLPVQNSLFRGEASLNCLWVILLEK